MGVFPVLISPQSTMHPRFHAKPRNSWHGRLHMQMHRLTLTAHRNCQSAGPAGAQPAAPQPARTLRAPPVTLDSPRRAVTGGASPRHVCSVVSRPPLESSTPPVPPLYSSFHAATMTQRGRVPRRRAVGASVRPPSRRRRCLWPSLGPSLSRRSRSPVEIPPSPDAPSVAHQRAWHALGGLGAAVLQPSTTARARSPIVMCCSSCSSSAPHQLLIS